MASGASTIGDYGDGSCSMRGRVLIGVRDARQDLRETKVGLDGGETANPDCADFKFLRA